MDLALRDRLFGWPAYFRVDHVVLRTMRAHWRHILPLFRLLDLFGYHDPGTFVLELVLLHLAVKHLRVHVFYPVFLIKLAIRMPLLRLILHNVIHVGLFASGGDFVNFPIKDVYIFPWVLLRQLRDGVAFDFGAATGRSLGSDTILKK